MSTLKQRMHTRALKPNPKPDKNVDWKTITNLSVIDDNRNPPYSPKKKDCFDGFTPEYPDIGPPVGQGRKGLPGRRRSVLYAGDEVLKAFYSDDLDSLNNSLLDMQARLPKNQINMKVTGGQRGAPFAMGITAIWTKQQLSAEKENMQAEMRQYTNDINRYHTPNEWKQIDSEIYKVVEHTALDPISETVEQRAFLARSSKFILPEVKLGDTYLHLAMRLNAVESCALLVEHGIDTTVLNSANESIVDLIELMFTDLKKRLKQVQKLKMRKASHIMAPLSKEENNIVKFEPRLIAKWDRFHDLCTALVSTYYEETLRIATIEHRAWRAGLEDLRIEEEAYAEIASKPRVQAYIEKCQKFADESVPEQRPGFEEDPVVPTDIANELATISSFSFLSENVQLDDWLNGIEKAATFVQAIWRGYFLRRTFHRAIRVKAVVTIQANWRGWLGRKLAGEAFVRYHVTKIQRCYRRWKKAQEYDSDEELWNEQRLFGASSMSGLVAPPRHRKKYVPKRTPRELKLKQLKGSPKKKKRPSTPGTPNAPKSPAYSLPPVTPLRKKLEEQALVPRSNQDEEKDEEEKDSGEAPVDPNKQAHVVQFSLTMRDLTLDAFTDDKKLEFIEDVAEALGIDFNRIHLADVRAGSVIIDVDIVGFKGKKDSDSFSTSFQDRLKFPVSETKYGQCYYKRLPKSTPVTADSPAHHHQTYDPNARRHHHRHHHKQHGEEEEKEEEKEVVESSSSSEEEIKDEDLHALHAPGEVEREGLGQNFRDSPWVPPEYEDAMTYRDGLLYEEGKASFCATGVSQLASMGVGVGLYFMVLRNMIFIFFLATLLAVPHLLTCYFGSGIAPVEYGLLEFGRDGAGIGVGVGGGSFTAASHMREWSSPGVGGYNVSGMCELVDGIDEPWKWTNGRQPSGLDTVFEDSVNCTEWLYNIPVLEPIAGTPFIRGRHMAYIISYCDVLYSLLILYGVARLRAKVMAAKDRLDDEIVQVEDYAVFVEHLPKDATQLQVRDHFNRLYRLNNAGAKTEPDWHDRGSCCGLVGRKRVRKASSILDYKGDPVGHELMPVAEGAAGFAEKPELYNGRWVCEVEMVHPEGHYINTFRQKSKGLQAMLKARAEIKYLKSVHGNTPASEAGKMPAPLARQSTGLRQMKLMTSKMSDKTYARKLKAAEKRLKKITAKVVASTQNLMRDAAHYREVKNTSIGAFVVFNHEESWRRCVMDYNQPRSIFGMLLCRGQPKPLQFRYGQGYKDPYGRSSTPGTSKNLLMDSTVGVSGRPTLNAKGAPKSYPKGYSSSLDAEGKKQTLRLGDSRVADSSVADSSDSGPDASGDSEGAGGAVEGGAPAGTVTDVESQSQSPAPSSKGSSRPVVKLGGGSASEGKATTIKVSKADRPGNVMWENIETSKKEIFVRKSLTSVVALALLLLCGGVIAYVKTTYVAISGKVPTVETCDRVLPAVYHATKEGSLEPPELVRKTSADLCDEGVCRSSCPDGTHWISYASAPSKWKHPDTNRTCVDPCVATDPSHDDMECRGDDGRSYTFSRGDVMGCFCMQRLADMTEEHGLFGGAEAMMRVHKDVCADFAWTYVSKKVGGLLTAGATVIINEALKAAIQFLGDLERNKTVTQRTISVVMNMFFCLFMNTAVIILIVNARFDSGVMDSMGFLEDVGKDGETDYSSTWYRAVGFSVVSTLFFNCFTPHAAPLSKMVIGPVKRWFYQCTGRPMTQFEMNKHYEPPVFELEKRAAQICNTMAVTLAFSAGLPILIPIATVSLVVSYAIDKYLLLRLYKRPPAYNAELPLQMLAMVPFMVFMHLANAVGFYANQDVFESVFFSRSIMGLDELAPYESGSYESGFYEDNPFIAAVLDRVWRANVVPVILVLVVCMVYQFAHHSIGALFFVLAKYVPCFSSCANTDILAKKAHNPPYTEEYARYYEKKKGCCKAGTSGVPTMPEDRGWSEPIFVGGGGNRPESGQGYYKLTKEAYRKPVGEGAKLRAHDDFWGTGEGLKAHGERQLTWEVVAETGCGSYQMSRNIAYSDIVLSREALKDTLDNPRFDDAELGDAFRPPSSGEKLLSAMESMGKAVKALPCLRPKKVAPDPTMGRGGVMVSKEVHIVKRVKRKKGTHVAHVKKKKADAMYDADKIQKMGDGSSLRNKLI